MQTRAKGGHGCHDNYKITGLAGEYGACPSMQADIVIIAVPAGEFYTRMKCCCCCYCYLADECNTTPYIVRSQCIYACAIGIFNKCCACHSHCCCHPQANAPLWRAACVHLGLPACIRCVCVRKCALTHRINMALVERSRPEAGRHARPT